MKIGARLTWTLTLMSVGCELPAELPRQLPESMRAIGGTQEPLHLHVEFLVDRSRSYPALGPALAAVCSAAKQLQPGDRMIARFVSERSYSAQEVILDLSLPRLSAGGGLETPAHRKKREAVKIEIDTALQTVCDTLPRPEEVHRADWTDYTGALAAASGSMRNDSEQRQRVLLISGDLQETVDPGDVTIDLEQVRVRFVAIEATARIETVQNSIRQWTEIMQEMGATDIEVIPPGSRPDLGELRYEQRRKGVEP